MVKVKGEGNEQEQELGPPPCLGAFTPMRPLEDADVLARFVHVPCRAGDLVLWDNRIPHANSREHVGVTPREVVYIGMLPPTTGNFAYGRQQRERFHEGRLPVDFWQGKTDEIRQVSSYCFSPLGDRLMLLSESHSHSQT